MIDLPVRRFRLCNSFNFRHAMQFFMESQLTPMRGSRPGCPVWKTRSDSVGKLEEFS